jgi:hypothetical protein
MIGLSLTVSEIYGIIVRPLVSIISWTAEPIFFKFRRSLDYVDLYKLPWPVDYISETARDRHTQKRGVILTFLKNVGIKLDETLPDDSYTCAGLLEKVRKQFHV